LKHNKGYETQYRDSRGQKRKKALRNDEMGDWAVEDNIMTPLPENALSHSKLQERLPKLADD
jgi:hypothetical protein